jgi:outer membrane receptor protein involved in Fe transport
LLLLLLLFLVGVVQAGTTGKFSGTVTDKENGDPLPGVAVSVVGTNWGAQTDIEGKFIHLNMPVGDYTLRAELIGFAPVEVQNLKISADLTTYVSIEMSSKVLDIGQVQIVVAERPLIIMDQTQSLKVVSSEEIQQMPTRGYLDVVSLSAGVVAFNENSGIRARGAREQTNTPMLQIRGGRQGEVAYYVDGFSQQDPLTNLSTTAINNNAIKEIEITTGGFNAEYGWVSSGAVNIATREGGRAYHGSFEVLTDNTPLHTSPPGEGEDPEDASIAYSYDQNVYAFNIDGPLMPNYDKATIFLSGERRWQKDRDPHATGGGQLPNNSLDGWTWQGKLKFDINPKNVLRLGTLGSRDKWSNFDLNYWFNQEHNPRFEDKNQSYYAKWTSTLSPQTFFEVGGSYYLTERERGDGLHFDDLDAYSRPEGNVRFDETALFWKPGHVWDDYLHRKSSYMAANFDITSQINTTNEIQFGVDLEMHRLRYYRHLFPTNIDPEQTDTLSYRDVDFYGYDMTGQTEVDDGVNGVKEPYTFAVFLQDKIEWQGLVVNAGLRYDYLNVNTDRLKNEELPLDPDDLANQPGATDEEIINGQLIDPDDFEPAESEQKISPRLGIGFPVSDKTVFHINYGKFFQRPELQYLYVNQAFLQRMIKDAPFYYPIGNPNLEPEETTAYEVGLQHQLGDNTAMNIAAYYKDVNGLTEVINQPSNPNAFNSYRNADFGTIKGMDFSLKMRRTQGISAEMNYSLSYAKGTGSYATSQSNIAWTNSERPLVITPLDFDQRHKITAILDVRAGDQGGPKLGDCRPLQNAGINFVFRAGSGTPYTPMFVHDEVTIAAVSPRPAGQVNSRYGPWTYRLDLKANKTFYVGSFGIDAYVWVLNLFDTENPLDVYEGSGLADNTRWLATAPGQQFIQTHGEEGLDKYNLKQQDPRSYDTPRQVRLGLRVSF